MEVDDKLYKAFLEEMHALENFRMMYAAEHPAAPLEREDPDVRRMVEAMALFAARARLAGVQNIVATRRRIFRQFLPYLLTPLPTMGMIQVLPTGKFTDVAVLPRGAEIAASVDNARLCIFRTMKELRILPLTLGRLATVTSPQGGQRLLLPVMAAFPRNEAIGQLNIYLNYFNDFQASMRVRHAMEKHLGRVSVSHDERVDETTKGVPCGLSFGLPRVGTEELWPHPVDRERLYFHFPSAELYVNLDVPAPPRNWQRFTLIFDLDPGWPRNLRLNKEVFTLFATPIVNLQRAYAEPIIHDGTKEQMPIRHPTTGAGFELHAVRGVYRSTGDAMVPLRSATLMGGPGSYEIDEDARAEGHRRPVLCVQQPKDFDAPHTLCVEADWIQPWFSELLSQKVTIAPYRHSFMGLEWELAGDMVPHRLMQLADGSDDFAEVLVLQNKANLNKEDLTTLLQVLSVWNGPFAQLRELLTDVKVREVPQQGNGAAGSLRLGYHLYFKEYDAGLQPLVEAFRTHLERILDAWIADAPVEVRLGEGQ